jgi:two-component system OmpR family sensor kinase
VRLRFVGLLRGLFGTLRVRLVLAAVSAILLAVALLAVAIVLLVGRELRGTLDSALHQRAQQVAELAVSAPAVLTDPGALESPVSGRQIAVEVLDAHDRLIAHSEALGSQPLPAGTAVQNAIARGSAGFADVKVGGRPFRLYAAPIAQAGGPAAGGAVIVASDTTDIDHTVGHIGLLVALIGAGVALAAAFAATLLTGRVLRPLRRLAQGAAEIERTADPAKRLESTTAADEVAALTGVLNRMLSSLDQARSSERRFLADASHELRTPVTALRGNVEYVARHGASEDVLADLRADAERLARLVDDLLVLERAGSVQPASEESGELALDALVLELAQTRARVELAELEPASVRGDRSSLERAIGNLIENALLHGPPGRPVKVSLRTREGRALLTVSDQGPGPPPAERARVFERFWRGQDALERPGSGLGLSIVDAIVKSHRGRVELHGSAFTIELPLSDRGAPARSGTGR